MQAKPLWVLNAFYWHQIFALDSDAVKAQTLFSSHRGLLTITKINHPTTLERTGVTASGGVLAD